MIGKLYCYDFEKLKVDRYFKYKTQYFDRWKDSFFLRISKNCFLNIKTLDKIEVDISDTEDMFLRTIKEL